MSVAAVQARLICADEAAVAVRFAGTLGTLAVTPISAKRIRRHVFVSRDHSLDKPDAELRAVVRPATEQDRAVVESQRPEELPVDLAEELHIKGPDTPSVEFRRMLAELER